MKRRSLALSLLLLVGILGAARPAATTTQDGFFDSNGVKMKDGLNFRSALGTYIRANFKDEIVKNVNLKTRLELFTNFLENFGDIDVNWQLLIEMKVNDWLSANLTMDVIYDKDIRFDVFDDSGNLIGDEDRIQFKQIFGIGLT